MNIRPDMHAKALALPTDLVRRLWTAAELRRLEDAGILRPEERIELIAGEIVKVSPKGARHEVLRNELVLYWARRLPADVKFAEEPPITLDDHYEPEPDVILFPATMRVNEVRGDNVLLVVEISDSSLAVDLGLKSRVYALFGVREYWVINTVTGLVTVHLEPSEDGYRQVIEKRPEELITPSLVQSLAVRIADLPLL